jgi:hypothetical protein
MKYVRMVLGVLVGLYSLMGLYHVVSTISHKTGMNLAIPGAAEMAGLMDAIAWWQVAVFAVASVAYGIAAWRLLRGGKALIPYAAAFVLDTVAWMALKGTAAYQAAFTAQELQMDYYIMGVLLLGLVLTWWTERDNAPSPAAA